MANTDNPSIIDRDTYRSIKKMSREEMNAFLLRYAENLSKDGSHTIDLSVLELEIKSIKGIGKKRAEEIMRIIENILVCDLHRIKLRQNPMCNINRY